MQPACLPRSSSEPTSNVSSCPSGGAISGTKPTVDAVVAQPLPAYWYYLLAGGGALLLLVTVTVMMILCSRRYHWAPEKSTSSSSSSTSSHHHSVMYHSCQQPYQPGLESYYYQSPNPSCNSNQNCLYPGTSSSLEPTLVITLEKNDHYGSRCWKDWTRTWKNWSNREPKNCDCPFKRICSVISTVERRDASQQRCFSPSGPWWIELNDQ